MGSFGKGPDGLKPGKTVGPKEVPLMSGGYLYVLGRRQSLQEANKSVAAAVKMFQPEMRGNARKASAITSQYFNILFALRTDRINGLPLAHEYLTQFIKRGWKLESLVVLSPTRSDLAVYRRFGVPTCYLDKNDVDRLQMIGRVRVHFGWA